MSIRHMNPLTPDAAVITKPRVSLHNHPRDHVVLCNHRSRKPGSSLRLPVAKSGNSELRRRRIVDMPRH